MVLSTSPNFVTRFVNHVSEVGFPQKLVQNFVSNRLAEIHICDKAHSKETGTVEVGVLFAEHPQLPKEK